jgi:hypothetical protein
MVRREYWNTGDQVPKTATYSTNCDNAPQQLNLGSNFPACPTCHLAASWREIQVIQAPAPDIGPA